MTLRVVFRRAAKIEFEDAAVWYDEQRFGLGEEFIIEIEQAIANAIRLSSVIFDARSHVASLFPCTSGYAQM